MKTIYSLLQLVFLLILIFYAASIWQILYSSSFEESMLVYDLSAAVLMSILGMVLTYRFVVSVPYDRILKITAIFSVAVLMADLLEIWFVHGHSVVHDDAGIFYFLIVIPLVFLCIASGIISLIKYALFTRLNR